MPEVVGVAHPLVQPGVVAIAAGLQHRIRQGLAACSVWSSLSSTTITTANSGYQANWIRSVQTAIAAVRIAATKSFRLLRSSWFCTACGKAEELEETLTEIAAQPDRAADLKVMIPAEESVGLPDNVIDPSYKLKTPTRA